MAIFVNATVHIATSIMRKATVLIAILMALAVSSAYADVIVFDDFEDGTIGEKYPGWEKVLAKYDPPTDTVEAGGANGTAKAYQLVDDSKAGQWFGKYFDPYSGELYLNFYAKNVEATTSLWLAIRQDETYGFYMEFDEAAGTPLNLGSVAGGKVALIPTYEADVWYHVQIKYDTS